MLAARAYIEELPHDLPRQFQFRFDAAPMPGYGWVFPLDRHSANVGVCFLPAPGRRRSTATTAQAFQRFINGPRLRQLLRGSRQVGPIRGYPIRVDFLSAPTSAQRTLLVGEAAGLVNPLTGEGIEYALESGRIAADHVVQALTSGVHDAWGTEYDRLLRARFEQLFRFSAWLRDWYCKPPLLNLLVALANCHPELRQVLASMVLGEREPRSYGPAESAARLIWYLARRPRRKFEQ
jgi:flavin-dependent dehydrogenase